MLTAIVQARMSSTRLPGKVLKEVHNRPLLSYLIERLQRVSEIEKIVVATTDSVADDAIAEYCKKNGISVFRGSENDVLDRYMKAAMEYSANPIVRITGDCPLLDVDTVQKLIEVYKKGGVDYVVTGQSFTEGFDCEIFSQKMLELSHVNATKSSEREHATLYMYTHPEVCRKFILENSTDDSSYRVTVDEPEDFAVVKTIIEGIYPNNSEFTAGDIKNFLDSHPEIRDLNKGIVRNEGLLKSLADEK